MSNSLDKTQEWLTVYLQPFFYGAITRLPFIYFVIHMRFAFELDWNRIGVFVGCYQATRVVTSVASIFCPGVAHLVGTAVGLAGNVLVIVSASDNQTNVILGTILVGASETLAAMQTYVKRRYGSDLEALEVKLKVQYAAVMVGVTFAFSLGGFIYQTFGMDGVAWFGAIMSIAELVSLISYFILEAFRPETAMMPLYPTEDEGSESSIDVETALEAQHDPISRRLMDSFSESGMGANYLSYALCFTFGMEAVTIGYNLAVSPVYITEIFQQNTTVVGILLASGAAFGTLTTITMALTKQGHSFMESFFPSPIGFLVAMLGISVSVCIAAVPVFPIHVMGLLFLMGFNDLAALLLNEMQGTITSSKAYSTLGPMGQVVRRSCNVVTAVTGPILFGILPQLPYIVAGSVTALWTIILAWVILHRSKANQQIMSHSHIPESVSSFFNSTTFSRKEIIARQVKKGRVTTAVGICNSSSMEKTVPLDDSKSEELIEFEC